MNIIKSTKISELGLRDDVGGWGVVTARNAVLFVDVDVLGKEAATVKIGVQNRGSYCASSLKIKYETKFVNTYVRLN